MVRGFEEGTGLDCLFELSNERYEYGGGLCFRCEWGRLDERRVCFPRQAGILGDERCGTGSRGARLMLQVVVMGCEWDSLDCDGGRWRERERERV